MIRTTLTACLAACLLLLQHGQAEEAEVRFRTTHPDIAVRNQDFLVNRMRMTMERNPDDPEAVRRLLDQLLTRTQFRGTLRDYDEALTVTERLLERRPDDPRAQLERARVLERLHRFDEAERLLAALEPMLDPGRSQHAAVADEAERARIRIQLARGEPETVLAAAEARAAEAPGFGSLTQLAFTLAALGRTEDAEAAYLRSLDFWDRISPFAIAWIEFQRGELHVATDPDRAALHYRRALDYLPGYITARVHLAEVMAEDGRYDEAIALLEAAVGTSEDPEVDSRLAEFLLAAGREEAAEPIRQRALAGYADLLERHPLAFLDHIAEFYLGSGGDPGQAWIMAERNWINAAGDPALALAIEAAAAAERPELCELLTLAVARRERHAELAELLEEHEGACSDGD